MKSTGVGAPIGMVFRHGFARLAVLMPDAPESIKQIEEHLGKDFGDLLRQLQRTSSGHGIAYEGKTILDAIGRFALLLSLLYVRAEQQTKQLITLTRDLITLTKILSALTAILIVLAGYSAVEPYFHNQTSNQAKDDKSEPRQSDQLEQITVPY